MAITIPTSYYKLDATGGADAVGSNTMTESNTSYVTGKISNACSFNGSTSTMRNGSITLATGTTAYSINFWVKLNSEIASGVWALFALGPDTTNQDTVYTVEYEYNGGTRRLNYQHYYNGPETYYTLPSNQTLGTSNWNMITLTYSGSVMKMYLNGTQIATGGGGGTYGFNGVSTYQKGLTIGSGYFLSAYTSKSNAIIDEFGYWGSTTLSTTEITDLYNGGSGLTYPFTTSTTNSGFFQFF